MNVKYPMTTLTKKSHLIERLEVQSFEMNVYLVKVTIAGEAGFVTDKKNSPTRRWLETCLITVTSKALS
jgi:hypothetical protein